MSQSHHRAPRLTFEYALDEMLRGATDVDWWVDSREFRGDAWDCHSADVARRCHISIVGDEHRLVVDSGTAGQETFHFRPFADLTGETSEFILVGAAELKCWVMCCAGPKRTLVTEGYEKSG